MKHRCPRQQQSQNMVKSLLVSPKFWPHPVYANYIGPSVMTNANCEGFPICNDRITENDRYVIKIIGIHCPPHPLGACDVSEVWATLRWTYKCTVKVWLLYDYPNFKYCTLFAKNDGITVGQMDKQTDGRTDRRMIQLLDVPSGPFRLGA